MPYVLTVDQQGSRRSPDRVGEALRRLQGTVPTLLPFERTAGDEFQGVMAEAADVVTVVLELVRLGGWSIGVGAGPVSTPLPDSTRAGSGPAFQKLCRTPRGFHTYEPTPASTSRSPTRAQMVPSTT